MKKKRKCSWKSYFTHFQILDEYFGYTAGGLLSWLIWRNGYCYHLNENNPDKPKKYCRVNNKWLAKRFDKDERTIKRYLKYFEELGILKRIRTKRGSWKLITKSLRGTLRILRMNKIKAKKCLDFASKKKEENGVTTAVPMG